MTGKEKCEILKQIRYEIAKRNGINYTPSVCNNESDCLGYCPICEKEAEYIISELNQRIKDGHPVKIELEKEFILKDGSSLYMMNDHLSTSRQYVNDRPLKGEIIAPPRKKSFFSELREHFNFMTNIDDKDY